MQKSTSKLLRSLSLAPALALLLLGSAAPRLAAQQSDNFDEDGAIPPSTNAAPGWSLYTMALADQNCFSNYPPAVVSFPANPASADNYAVEMYSPPIIFDTCSQGPPRAAIFRTEQQYGSQGGGQNGRFYVASDLIAWNTNGGYWRNQLFGLCWYTSETNLMTLKTYLGGWGPDLGTLGIIALDANAGLSGFTILGVAAPENTVQLDPTHQYRLEASSHDGETFLLRLFDLADPDSPWLSAITDDTTFYDTPGYSGIVEANYEFPPPEGSNSTAGTDGTFDNYLAYLPAANTMPAIVTDLSPRPGGNCPDFYPKVTVGILNRDTTVLPNTIQLYLDGALIPANSPNLSISNSVFKPYNSLGTGPTNFDGATVTCQITNLFTPGSRHTNTIVFQDYLGGPHTWFTNTWSWTAHTAPTLLAANSLPIGALGQRGFKARMVATTDTWGNSVANAFMVLDYPATNASAVALASTNIVPLVAWDIVNPPTHNGAVTNFPGQCLPAGNPNYFAVQVQAYLQLTAGGHRFHVDSDDNIEIFSGTNPGDTSGVLLYNEAVTHADFDCIAPADGLYPINIIFEEGNGDAYLCLYSVNLLSGVQSLVNTNGGAVAAFYPPPSWNCMSSTSVKGLTNYITSVGTTLVATNAVATTPAGVACSGSAVGFNQTVTGWSGTGTNTVTLPAPSSSTYYRLYGPGSTKILGCKISGTNLVLTCRWQTP